MLNKETNRLLSSDSESHDSSKYLNILQPKWSASNYNDIIDDTFNKKHVDQKKLIYDFTRSISSYFLMNNYFKILNRRLAIHENTRISFLL